MSEDLIVKEVKVTIEYNPVLNTFSSSSIPLPGTGPEFIWEALKTLVMQMVKAAPYVSDPMFREHLETAAKSMRLIALGTEAAAEQARATQKNINKELRP